MATVLEALRAAAAAKAAYWDCMSELEAALGAPDPIDSVNNFLVERVDDIAVGIDDPSENLDWIRESDAAELQARVAALEKRFDHEAGNETEET